ncbi:MULTISPECIES: helix-turn-helix transcriptional regulator [unclassified Pseudomonas]|uniref:helix-turn-helix transcriptional regulator n=1 Tax=unclassified Pseudomonas TaxID=196821 RepID=UPI0013140693|nr:MULTISPECIES: helix-turn-helix transcriptional regulator [unclassified Pseudomonas]
MSRRRELGLFLRSRREGLTPEAVGLATGLRRRALGLRREEVAELAGISVDWYTRLEQGRVGSPSTHTLDALARALHLAPAEYAHLQLLIQPHSAPAVPAQRIPAALARVVEQWQYPSYVVNERWDLLAWNDAAAAVFGDFGGQPGECANLLRYMLLDETAQQVFGDTWAEEAQRMVGKFRRLYDQHAGSKAFDALIGDLNDASACFVTWWQRHDIISQGTGRKHLRDQSGILRAFEYLSMHPADAPQLRLALYMPVA